VVSAVARAGLAHWFFGNLYEAIVHVPERLTPDDALFTAGSPVRYYLPVAPVTLGAHADHRGQRLAAGSRSTRAGRGRGLCGGRRGADR
jgi:hypothetical protein